jgi:cytochrome c
MLPISARRPGFPGALGLALPLSLALAAPLQAKFTWEGCADFKETEFRYVKVVTRSVDPTLDEPLKVAFDAKPDGKVDLYYVERHGRVKRWNAAANTVTTLGKLDVYSDSPERAAQTGDTEHGLNGIALDPAFRTNGYIYLFYPPWSERTFRLSRFTVTGDRLDPASEKVLLSMPESRDHPSGTLILLPGGALSFDAHGDLWVAIGADSKLHPAISETEWSYSAEASSGNLADLRGSVLRIRPDNSVKGYSIPAGNMGEYWSARFAQEGKAALAAEYKDPAKVLPEIFVKGTRNPYTLNVDPLRRWVAWGDYGPNGMGVIKVEELNLATAPSFHGFPWFVGKNIDLMDRVTGMTPKSVAAPQNLSKWNKGPVTLPPAEPALYTYSNAVNGFLRGNHPTAGPFYAYAGENPSAVKLPPHFDKAFFVAERTTGLRVFKVSDNGTAFTDSVSLLTSQVIERPLDLQQGPDGALYVVDYGNGWHATSAGTHIGRVEYTGPCRPTTPRGPSGIARDLLHRAAPESSLRARLTGDRLRIDAAADLAYDVRLRDARGRTLAAFQGRGPVDLSLASWTRNTGLNFVHVQSGKTHLRLAWARP